MFPENVTDKFKTGALVTEWKQLKHFSNLDSQLYLALLVAINFLSYLPVTKDYNAKGAVNLWKPQRKLKNLEQ